MMQTKRDINARRDKLIEITPKIIESVAVMVTMAVTKYHNPDLQQMQTDVSASLEGIYAEARATSKDPKGAVWLENLMRQTIPVYIQYAHDPDKEVMYTRCQEAKEVMPGLMAQYAREQAALSQPFWQRWFSSKNIR